MDTTVVMRSSATKSNAPLFWATAVSITGLIAALYASVLADLAAEWWNDSAASHGMLIPPIAAAIAWMRRRTILAAPARPSLAGLSLTAAGCLLLLAGKLSAEFFLARISFVVILAGMVWTFFGRDHLRRLAFPFVLLTTMVPLPTLVYNTVAAPLQLFASNLATSISQALGVSVFRDGNIIHLAQTSLGVEEACSGLHSLSAMVIGSLLLGFVEELRTSARVLLFVLSVPLAIAINVLRVTGTALLADYRLEYAMGFYHLFSGWIVFVAGFGLLWVGARVAARIWGRMS